MIEFRFVALLVACRRGRWAIELKNVLVLEQVYVPGGRWWGSGEALGASSWGWGVGGGRGGGGGGGGGERWGGGGWGGGRVGGGGADVVLGGRIGGEEMGGGGAGSRGKTEPPRSGEIGCGLVSWLEEKVVSGKSERESARVAAYVQLG
jgi:CspA family cold shock protein